MLYGKSSKQTNQPTKMVARYIKIQSHPLRVPAKTLTELVSIARFLSYQSQLSKKTHKTPNKQKNPQTQYLP